PPAQQGYSESLEIVRRHHLIMRSLLMRRIDSRTVEELERLPDIPPFPGKNRTERGRTHSRKRGHILLNGAIKWSRLIRLRILRVRQAKIHRQDMVSPEPCLHAA